MKQEDIELFKNPYFVVYAVVFISLVLLIRIYFINKSKKDKNKITGFGFGVIPFRESMYDFFNKRHILQIIILGIILAVPTVFGLRGVIVKDPEYIQDLRTTIGLIMFGPAIFFGVLLWGWVYKRAKDKGVDATGADASIWQSFRFVQGKATSWKTWIKWEIVIAIGAIVYSLYLFIQAK